MAVFLLFRMITTTDHAAPHLAISTIFNCSSINLLCCILLQRDNGNPFLVAFFRLKIRLERERLAQLGGGKALMKEAEKEEGEGRGGASNGCWKLHEEKEETKIMVEEGGLLEEKEEDKKVEDVEEEQEERLQQHESAQQHSAILAKSLASVAQTYDSLHSQRFNTAHMFFYNQRITICHFV